MLNDRQIKELRPVEPWDETLVQPASLDVRLGSKILIPVVRGPIVIGVDQPEYIEDKTPWEMKPGEFILCHTKEEFRIPANVAGKFEGKSSLGRLGLQTHITAGFIDPGYIGDITLELKNSGPFTLILREGKKIGQVQFWYLSEAAEKPYGHKDLGSHYQNSVGTVGYKL